MDAAEEAVETGVENTYSLLSETLTLAADSFAETMTDIVNVFIESLSKAKYSLEEMSSMYEQFSNIGARNLADY
jgi:secreted Zn-dependent insulinase-like peptidase